MVKNYRSTVLHSWICVALFGIVNIGQGQEIRIFTISDFDLKGPVKSCLVSTKYGKEAYDFDKQGKLREFLKANIIKGE